MVKFLFYFLSFFLFHEVLYKKKKNIKKETFFSLKKKTGETILVKYDEYIHNGFSKKKSNYLSYDENGIMSQMSSIPKSKTST